jgi:predicted RNA-binding protein YlqC (UPF0109 family)
MLEREGLVESTVLRRQQRRNEDATRQLESAIRRIIHELVDDPAACDVRFTYAGNLALIEVFPNGPAAAGQVIGKQGRTIGALRTLAMAFCAKYGWRAQLEIVG